MTDQKNHKDVATTEHHLLENKVVFELLWRCTSKIWNKFGMATYIRGKNYSLVKYRYGYYKGSNIFPLFKVVSMPLGFVTSGLLGFPCIKDVWILEWIDHLKISCVHSSTVHIDQKIPLSLPYWIREAHMSANYLATSGLQC